MHTKNSTLLSYFIYKRFATKAYNFFIYVLFYVLLSTSKELDALALLLYTRDYNLNTRFDYLRIIEICTKSLKFLLYRKRLQYCYIFVIKQ